MGFFDRVEKIASGAFGAVQAPFGLIKDFAVAPFKDEDDFDGFFNTIKARGAARGGQVLGNLFGPKEGFGALIGGLPEDQVRRPVRKVFDGLEWTYREGLAEPAATLAYVSNQASLLGEGRTGDLFDPDVWREGYRRAQTTSVGQTVALDLLGADLSDDTERERAAQSRFFTPLSGSVDAAFRLFADPTVVGGKAVSAVRVAKVIKPITAKTDLDAVVGTDRFTKFNAALEGKSASEIRDQFFPNDVNGAVLSSALAEAGDAVTRAKVLRLGMGDARMLDELRLQRADIAGRLERANDERALLRSLDPGNFARVNARTRPVPAGPAGSLAEQSARTRSLIEDADLPRQGLLDEDYGAAAAADRIPSEVERLEDEINALHDLDNRLLRNESIIGQIRNQPRYRRLDEARVAVTRSQFYQSSKGGAVLRTTFNMRPPRMLELDDPAGDVAMTQWLRTGGLTKQEQDGWRTRYMAAPSPEARSQVAIEAEEAIVERLMAEAGLSRSEVEKAMTGIRGNRQTAAQMLKSRAYDGEGRSRLTFKDDTTGELHDYPLLVTQTANVLPLADLKQARKVLAEIAEQKRRFPGKDVPEDLLTKFNQVWKPYVLFRVGWPIRVVTDEQLRIISKVGVLSQLKTLGPGVANKAYNEIERAKAVATRAEGVTAKEAAEAAPKRGIGFGTVEVGEYTFPRVFGEDAREPNFAYNLTSSKPAFDRLIREPADNDLRELRQRTGEFRSITPQEKDYGPAWSHAVNMQLGQDPLARIFLEGFDLEDAVSWLKSPAGLAHQRRLPLRRSNLEAWAGAVQDQVEAYTLGNPEIMQAALRQQARFEDLVRLAPDASMRPVVHGEILNEAMGFGATAELIGKAANRLYEALGSRPSDLLSRHPFADQMYVREVERLTDLLDTQAKAQGRRLSTDDLTLIRKRATEYSISQTRKLLYDLAEQSDLAHLLRFVSPFYSAWQETMTRWVGIAVENPAYVARLRQVWLSPERAGIVTDEKGNTVEPGQREGDTVRYPDGTVSEIGRERLITWLVPEWAKDVPGFGAQGAVAINKRSLNLILSGNPGTGVPVQIPVNEIVKERPDLAESLRWVLPFGPSQDTKDLLLNATSRRLDARTKGEEDDVFKNAALRIYFDRVVDYNLGKTAEQPTWKEALKDTRSFYNMRTVASLISPAAPGFRSPYQPYIDAYRRMRAENLATADQRFLDLYGAEFFPLTAAFTKSADGVAPTVEAFTARSKYKDLIEADPELGAFIIGEEGAGEFSSAVYQSQKANRVGPGSTTNQRYSLSFEQAAAGPEVKLGWMEYRRVVDLIEVEREKRGLPNLQVKAAEDLAEIKRQMVAKLKNQYPAWYDAFSKVDRNAMGKRLVAMRTIAYDPRMEGRPEMRGVRTYLEARQVLRNELDKRKSAGMSGELDSAANRDLAFIWESLVTRMTSENLAFADTYTRYLERDDLSAA